MANHNLIVHYQDREYWIDNADEDLYLYVKMMVELYKLIDKRDVNLTILCGNDFFIKN